MTLTQTLPAYQPALFALALACLIPLIQSFLVAPLAFISGEQAPGHPIKGDETHRSFRVLRTYNNTVENLPAFGLAVLLALLLGVSPTLTNWLAGAYVALRLAFWAIYYAGIGIHAGGPRTLVYVASVLANMALLLATLQAALTLP